LNFSMPWLASNSRSGKFGARRRLLRAHAGDPGLLAGERAHQRFDLAHGAAALAQLDRIVERVDAVLRT
jgi:hypothetical protein